MDLGPIHVPYRYNEEDTTEQKIIYALGQLGEATAIEISNKLKESNAKETISEHEAEQILKQLHDHGLIKAEDKSGEISYNLSKILKPNAGKTDLSGIDNVV